jgi:hypothetical protein
MRAELDQVYSDQAKLVTIVSDWCSKVEEILVSFENTRSSTGPNSGEKRVVTEGSDADDNDFVARKNQNPKKRGRKPKRQTQ